MRPAQIVYFPSTRTAFVAVGLLHASANIEPLMLTWCSVMVGRKKKKKLDHLSEYSYQVKASSRGGNSHYLIIPEIMQVRSWKGMDFLGIYEICWMPALFFRIPESGFQITKQLKNLIFKNQMKMNPKWLVFKISYSFAFIENGKIILFIQYDHCKNCMIEHTCKHLASQSFTYTRRYTVNLINY